MQCKKNDVMDHIRKKHEILKVGSGWYPSLYSVATKDGIIMTVAIEILKRI
jgi:hypothetical protein